MRVLILGCGYTGSELAKALLQRGIAVHITNRSGHCPPDLAGSNLSCYQFSGGQGEPPSLDPGAYEAVTHILSSIPPGPDGEDWVVSHILPKLRSGSLDWVGYLSTTGVYGDCLGAWVEETQPVNPQNTRSRHRVQAEAEFLASGLPSHIFRLSGIYGPGSGRNIFARLQSGKAQHIVRPGHVFSRIHVEDIVQTLWASMTKPRPGEIYNVADDLPTESSQLILEACRLMEQPPPPPLAWEEANLSPMAASFWQESRRVSNFKIKSELGISLRYPTYKEGLAQIWQTEIRANNNIQPA